jgi:hypothetical protein
MWSTIKTIIFGLLDLFVVVALVKWLFQTPARFFKAFWRVGRNPGFDLISKDKGHGELDAVKLFIIFIALAFLIYGEQSWFY